MKKIILISLFIIILAAVILAVGLLIFMPKPYYAVHINTGDIYFGKLSRFPYLTLSGVWYLQRDSQQNISLIDFSKSAWGPENKITITRSNVVWMSKISPSSSIISVLKGEENASSTSQNQ